MLVMTLVSGNVESAPMASVEACLIQGRRSEAIMKNAGYPAPKWECVQSTKPYKLTIEEVVVFPSGKTIRESLEYTYSTRACRDVAKVLRDDFLFTYREQRIKPRVTYTCTWGTDGEVTMYDKDGTIVD